MTYDPREAIELLTSEAMRAFRPKDVPEAAGVALLAELGALRNAIVAVNYEEQRRAVAFRHMDQLAHVHFTKNPGFFHITIKQKEIRIEGILFDPDLKTFRTELPDESLVPTPGEPLPYRSPLAVIVATVLKAIHENPAEN